MLFPEVGTTTGGAGRTLELAVVEVMARGKELTRSNRGQ